MATNKHGLACVVLVCCVTGTLAIADPAATVAQGKLRGRRMQTHTGRNIFAFLGVPYAKPPLGDLRFRAPEPPESWEGFRDTKRHGNPCPQREYLFEKNPPIIGDEDCLFLNVYTTQLRPEAEAHPVLVYIHGGGWQSGQGSIYGPEYLLDHDLVLVTLNYRLGPLGFLSTEDEVSPGNYGLKDQIAALRWVRDNIGAFKGDPNRVTIAGQSAGGASVHYLTISPPARGLFHGAISMSGTSLAPWASARQPALQARRLATLLGCPEEPNEQLVSCLRTKDAALFVDAPLQMLEWDVDPLLLFSPAVEPPHAGERVVPAPPMALLRETERLSSVPVPWMTGLTAHDGSMRTAVISSNNGSLIAELNGDFEKICPITLRFQESSSDPSDTARKIRKFYFEDKPIDKDMKNHITDMYNDRLFLYPISKSLEALNAFFSERPVFLYQVSHRGKHSITEALDPDSNIDYGVCHLDDLQYLFYVPAYYPAGLPVDPNHPDHQMMKLMTQLFADFIRTGHPTPESDQQSNKKDEKNEKPFEWQTSTFTDTNFADLRLPKPAMISDVFGEKKRAFWKSLALEEHKLPLSHTEL